MTTPRQHEPGFYAVFAEPCAREHRAIREADEATALPRYWPAWAVVIGMAVALASFLFPLGFAA